MNPSKSHSRGPTPYSNYDLAERYYADDHASEHSSEHSSAITIGKPNDRHEQEADQVANAVTSGQKAPTISPVAKSGPTNAVQRKTEEDEKSLQMKSNQPDSTAVAPEGMAQELEASAGGGAPLSGDLKQEMESGFGRDLSGVRMHTDQRAAAMNKSVNARAFTIGKDVYFNDGAYAPQTPQGKHLIAHELTHTVQQNGSGANTIQRSGIEEDDDKKRSGTARSKKVNNEKGQVGTYTTKSGESFADVATKFGITLEELCKLNGLTVNSDGKVVSLKPDGSEVEATINGDGELVRGLGGDPELIRVPDKTELNLGKGDASKYTYKTLSGEAFIEGADDRGEKVAMNDVKQGFLGDCYLMAGMAALAKTKPSVIEDLITPLPDNKYKVKLYVDEDGDGKYTATYVTVNSDFPTKSNGKPIYGKYGDEKTDGTKELWPMILEKAVAVYNFGYDAIENGKSGKAMRMFTGNSYQYKSFKDMTGDQAITKLKELMDGGNAVSVSSKKKDDLTIEESTGRTAEGVVGNHAYVVVKVIATDKTVILYNPWRSRHIGSTTNKEMPDARGNAGGAISGADLVNQFKGVYSLKPD